MFLVFIPPRELIMETPLSSLWLPIVVSGIALFIASFIAWMVLPHHRKEWKTLPNEAQFEQLLRGGGVEPGQYMFPHCPSPEEWKSEAFQQRLQSGPNGALYIWQPGGAMGGKLFCTWLLFTILSFIIAYLAGIALHPGTAFMKVFQFVGTAGILTYGSSGLLNAIWFRRKIGGDIADGIAYGLITGLVFAALWPK
jgi:hypothetical protein